MGQGRIEIAEHIKERTLQRRHLMELAEICLSYSGMMRSHLEMEEGMRQIIVGETSIKNTYVLRYNL